MKKIAIVGAGPAGIFTAMLLKDKEVEVHLFEQNEVIGKKLKMTGGGRMNVANKFFSVDQFSSSESRLLQHFFKNPLAQNPIAILEALDVQYQWEGNRAILKSQNAKQEVERLEKALKEQKNLSLHLNTKILEISKNKTFFEIIKGDQSKDFFDAVVLSGGGMFRVGDLGNEEKIYALPKQLGHCIETVSPSLSPLTIPTKPFRKLAGVSWRAELTDVLSKKSVTGDLVLTHWGISGPAVLDFSTFLTGKDVLMNFLPAMSENDFVSQFNRLRKGKHRVRRFLKSFLPGRVVDFLLHRSEVMLDQYVTDVSKEKFNNLRNHIFRFELNDVSLQDYAGSWTTKGGVSLKEVNVSTLESKIHSQLFFAGEILDVNGLCGGYNISFAAICARVVANNWKQARILKSGLEDRYS